MLWKTSIRSAAAIAAFLAVFGTEHAVAEQRLTAGAILEKMPAEERFTYLAGLIEGLAHARFIMSGNDQTVKRCIFDWYYKTPQNRRKIEAAFKRYPEHGAAPIVLALTKPVCGG